MSNIHDPHSEERKSRGFSLLELMIVVFIVSVLAMVVLPRYIDYSTRAKVSEGVNFAGEVKKRVTLHYYGTGAWPANNAEAGLSAPGDYRRRYLESITVGPSGGRDGTITIAFDVTKVPPLSSGNTIVFYPDVLQGVAWHCDLGSMDKRYRPSICQ